MDYAQNINGILRPKINKHKPLVVDLFAGCGGLTLGFEARGFETIGYEMESDCVATYNKNMHGECIEMFLKEDTEYPRADIVIGGPPCQPFSVGGNQKGLKDARDGFPAFIAAIKNIRPKFWMFENVKGLLYKNKWYLEQVLDALQKLGYKTDVRLHNAVNFEVPQNRERLIAVGWKRGEFKYPVPIMGKVTAGMALGRMAQQVGANPRFLTPSMDKYVAKYEAASKCVTPRDLKLHAPARTLTCRNLAGATGDMHRVLLPDGRRRMLSVREAARLQSFPDWFEFQGSNTSQYKQIGNAVPPLLAYHLAGAVEKYIETI